MKKMILLTHSQTNYEPVFFKGNLMKGIEKAAEYGYDGVELIVRTADECDYSIVKEKLSKNNLIVGTIGTGISYVDEGLGLYTSNNKKRKIVMNRLHDIIDLAAFLPSKGVSISGIRGNDEVVNDYLDRVFLESMQECCYYAKTKGVEIYIEPVNRLEISCIFNVLQGMDFIKKVGTDNMGLILDVYQMNIEEKYSVAPIFISRDLLKIVHFSDTNRMIPGYGHYNFKEIVGALEAINFSGNITIEALPYPDDEKAMAQAKAYLDILLG